jgi:16S rRNA (cytosine1402-N4)-methyltransferase
VIILKFGVKKDGRSIEWDYGKISRVTLPMSLLTYHQPVLLPEVIEALQVAKGKKYIDATAGGGGYLAKILDSGGSVLGIDADADAIRFLNERFRNGKSTFEIGKNLYIKQGNFRDVSEIANEIGWELVDGIVYDLGMSSHQIGESGRGFSYRGNEPLDMRMDQRRTITAADILNSRSREELYEIFITYAEELNSRAISEAIVRTRALKRFETVQDLVSVIEKELDRVSKNPDPLSAQRQKYATLARIFQALRIVVNDELKSLKKSLADSVELLKSGSRVVVLSYHSLEDRIVKQLFLKLEREQRVHILSRQPITATHEENSRNQRARSAKLRIAEKL